jgi:hypothetical protein
MASTGPYRAKVFSCLRALPEEVFEQGLKRLEARERAGIVLQAATYCFGLGNPWKLNSWRFRPISRPLWSETVRNPA